jgi:mannitol/fructose-specific phosphotransferase system IIA component
MFTLQDNQIDLPAMLVRGGSWHNVSGKDPSSFITAALMAMRELGQPDRLYLAEAMIGREKASPTAMGDGLAFPHPIADVPTLVGDPFVAVAYPRFPVPWGAPDGMPVMAAFFVVCGDRNYHLLTLSALAKQCSRNELKAALMDEAPISELIALINSRR